LGFHLVATEGTARVLRRAGVDVEVVSKVSDRSGSETIVDRIVSGDIDMIFNTPFGRGARTDGYFIRAAAVEARVPCITTMAGIAAAVQAIDALVAGGIQVKCLQEHIADASGGRACC
ncbi:MAG TPA: carbamoyl phosphate synthase large subunit, partial [Actinomycetota bacterium]|nr:carbamoyl phosphate synthase large subunit [Actinomycetota bacterium]